MRIILYIVISLIFSGCAFYEKKRADLPSINLLMIDSTVINTGNIPEGKPIVMMFFSPECKHCQYETESLLQNAQLFKNILFYLISADPLEKIKSYSTYFHLTNYPNFIPVMDNTFSLFYQLKPDFVPYFFIYNKHKKLFAALPGSDNINLIDSLVHTLK
jgi:thiol-disulfide isomerase/thioredoxin